MRKYLIIILIVIFIVLIGISGVKGLNIGSLNIKSISQIAEDSESLDSRLQALNEKNTKDYKSLEDDLENKNKELKKQQENYADLILFSTESGESINNLYEKYEIEFLWTKLGNHATKNGLTMKLEVTNGSSGVEDLYNLNFTLTGNYVSIIDCIKGIEDDDTLGFKIEDFSLSKDSGSEESSGDLKATFSVKDVNISKIGENTAPNTPREEDEDDEDSTKDNTTDKNTTNTVTNTVN